jgi:hypothetical protein
MTNVYDADGQEVGGWSRLTMREVHRRQVLTDPDLQVVSPDPRFWRIAGQRLDPEVVQLIGEATPEDWAAVFEVLDTRIAAGWMSIWGGGWND